METFGTPEKSPADTLVEHWKHGPTLLASTSELRKHKLAALGFTDINLAPAVPEDIETKLGQTLNENSESIRTHFDSDGRRQSEHIAAAKVRYILTHEPVDPATLVIAFDTTSIIYDEANDVQIMGIPQSAEKYADLEVAKVDILQRFKMLAAGIQEHTNKIAEFRRMQEAIGGTPEDIDEILAIQSVGLRRGFIYIHTAAAIAFPDSHTHIHCCTEEVKLYSVAIAKTDGDEQALEKLVELLIASQGPEKTLSISGGIDYADSYVRNILDIHEASFPDQPVTDESLYRGFAPRAINLLLTAEARRVTT